MSKVGNLHFGHILEEGLLGKEGFQETGCPEDMLALISAFLKCSISRAFGLSFQLYVLKYHFDTVLSTMPLI